jgi:hypothetical protein
MKKARQQRRAQGDFENRLSNDSNTTSPHAPQLFEAFFARREPCRKCSAMVRAFYHFTSDGMAAGWGALPIGQCDRPDHCGETLEWLDDGNLWLARSPAGGAA